MPKVIERTPELANAICKRLMLGDSLRSICLDDAFPSADFVCEWLKSDTNFAEQYTRAREIQADTYAEKTLQIAENATPETAQVARLQVDTLKWHASKLLPKKYGDKAGDVNVLNQTNNIVVLPEAERKELMAKHEAMLTAIEQKRLEQ